MGQKFAVSYERWNEDALNAGDTDDRGMVVENVSLTDAIRLGLEVRDPSWINTPEANEYPIRWLTFSDWNGGTRDYYESGVEESRSLHIPDEVSDSSRRRICRLFGLQVRR